MQISLIDFSLKNYKAFQKQATFSMLTRKNEDHSFQVQDEHLLKASFIYGPNASGKSTLLEGISLLLQLARFSANTGAESRILAYNPFAAAKSAKPIPVYLELTFALNGQYSGIYSYSFSFTSTQILTEKLTLISGKDTEKILFQRNGQDMELKKGPFAKDKILIERTRKEALFLSVAAQFNNEFALALLQAFTNIHLLNGLYSNVYRTYTINRIANDPDFKKRILKYLKIADFCISDSDSREVNTHMFDIHDGPEKLSATKSIKKAYALFLKHPIYDSDHKKVDEFELPLELESIGTQNFLHLLGPILDTLDGGKVLLIDEFDNSLHPLLTKLIIDLFESPEHNPHNAQLIVTTHDTSLLSHKEDFIKDQFWFTEKDQYGASRIFSLAEFNLRNDTEYARKYFEGRFGGLPYISSLYN